LKEELTPPVTQLVERYEEEHAQIQMVPEE